MQRLKGNKQNVVMNTQGESNIPLSVLICTLPQRLSFAFEIIQHLNSQCINNGAELLWLGDNKFQSVGEKRNHLKNMARGRYIVFVDDDDWVSDDYVEQIVNSIKLNDVDVICPGGYYTCDGKDYAKIDLDKKHDVNHNERTREGTLMCRRPNHLCAVRREIAKDVDFPLQNLGEDHRWADKIADRISTQHKIEKEIYHYRYSNETTETRKKKVN